MQLAQMRALHQFGHAIDDNHRPAVVLSPIKEFKQSRGILAVQHMNDEDDFALKQIVFDMAPLVFGKWTTEVVSAQLQIDAIITVDLALCVTQRRQQTRPDVENRDLHY